LGEQGVPVVGADVDLQGRGKTFGFAKGDVEALAEPELALGLETVALSLG